MIIYQIQGAGIILKPFENTLSPLKALEEIKGLNPKVLFSSRKLLRSLESFDLPLPTEIRKKSKNDLTLIWCYRGLYLELNVIDAPKGSRHVEQFQPITANIESSS